LFKKKDFAQESKILLDTFARSKNNFVGPTK